LSSLLNPTHLPTDGRARLPPSRDFALVGSAGASPSQSTPPQVTAIQQREEHDVIVVGAGGSGLAAALSAAQRGARVLVLERREELGGTTGIAVGSFTAAGTPLQRDAGIEDSPEWHAEDAAKFAHPDIESRNNAELRAFFLREAAESLTWLQKLGVVLVGPSPEPPNRVARMHNVVHGANAYIAKLQAALEGEGGSILCQAEVTELLREGARVVGVEALVRGVRQQFRATRGVVLAAGDYAGSAELIARFKGDEFGAIEGINPHALGQGHTLAESAGARLVNMDVTYGPELRFPPSGKTPLWRFLPTSGFMARLMGTAARHLPDFLMRMIAKRLIVTWQHPENALFDDGAILVNREGRRFVNEKAWPEREMAVAQQPSKVAFLYLDARLVDRYSKWPHFISTAPDIAYAYVRDYQRLRPDVTKTGLSPEDLARRTGLPSESLAGTVADFNRYVSGEMEDRFGRTGDTEPLGSGPCLLLGPVKAYFTTTEGGAAIDRQLRVLDEHGEAIPGLYAVGQNGLGGMILWGHGLHIAWAITSGRLAGEAMMEECGGE